MSEAPIPDGWAWNEYEFDGDNPLNAHLIALLVITSDLSVQLIGTAFIIRAEGGSAVAISAAHCFDEIRKLLHPNAAHHVSALPEFLPASSEINLESVKGIYLKDGVAHSCSVELAVWDSTTDLAVITVTAPRGESELFQDCIWLDDEIPREGDIVVMVGFGDMSCTPDADSTNAGRIELRALMRVGTVEGVHMDGYFMVKHPCIETSIAIFSGMSGGLVARWTGPDTKIKAFALISHAPEPQPSLDCSVPGHSVATILPLRKTVLSDQAQIVALQVKNIHVGRLNVNSQQGVP